jgi:hypothetical protein
VNAQQLAHQAATASLMRKEGRPEATEAMAARLKASLGHAGARVETDLEALIQTEGLAARPGPRTCADPEIMAALRLAIPPSSPATRCASPIVARARA